VTLTLGLRWYHPESIAGHAYGCWFGEVLSQGIVLDLDGHVSCPNGEVPIKIFSQHKLESNFKFVFKYSQKEN